MSLLQSKIDVGAKRLFSIVHISDTHLTYADMRDGKTKVRLSESRKKMFPLAEETLLFACL